MFNDDNFDVDNLSFENQEYYRRLSNEDKKVFAKAYQLGYDQGETNGKEEGYSDGHDDGYDEGYDNGGNDEYNGMGPYFD